MKITGETRYYCDKCGKEIEVSIENVAYLFNLNTKIPEVHLNGFMGKPSVGFSEKVNLCDDCLIEYKDWRKINNDTKS